MILELSTDSLFHDRVARIDTRTDTDFAPSDGEISFTGVTVSKQGICTTGVCCTLILTTVTRVVVLFIPHQCHELNMAG